MRPLKATLFRQYYDRADLPISMLHRAGGNRLKWHVRPQDLDYHAYLPLFFDGLCEVRRQQQQHWGAAEDIRHRSSTEGRGTKTRGPGC